MGAESLVARFSSFFDSCVSGGASTHVWTKLPLEHARHVSRRMFIADHLVACLSAEGMVRLLVLCVCCFCLGMDYVLELGIADTRSVSGLWSQVYACVNRSAFSSSSECGRAAFRQLRKGGHVPLKTQALDALFTRMDRPSCWIQWTHRPLCCPELDNDGRIPSRRALSKDGFCCRAESPME